ncbi:DNA-3-methyladenine glycosylase family protein [Propionibacteriaceae bacterium G57]|uniref:DNA-3-methyladenine glycosylase family protein n=1 Tax=Aestuariimicrobium sp. G57 TaxID=3418485 RepID=UPI003DA7064A
MSSSIVIRGVGAGLDGILGRLQRGHGDPTTRLAAGSWWRAAITPDGPVLLRLTRTDEDVTAEALGDGAAWALDRAPLLLGVDDRPDDFTPDHDLLAVLLRRRSTRIGGTGLLAESLAQTIIEQKVTGAEAFTSIRRLVRRFGEQPPGIDPDDAAHPAAGMVAAPAAGQWAAIPSWEYLQAGVDERRAGTIARAMAKVGAFERVLARAADEPVTPRGEALERALRTLPGIGPWTAAKVRQNVLGDPDAWSIDDYHVPGMVSAHLADGGDPGEALEPFRPHRWRVEIALMGLGLPERHGPRRTLPSHLPVRGGWTAGGRGQGRWGSGSPQGTRRRHHG